MGRSRALVVAIFMVLARAASGETIDMATFTPPAGWTREAKPGGVAYSMLDAKANAYGMVAVFNSVPSTGDPQRDFTAAWKALVGDPSNVAAPAQQMQQKTPQGFPMVLGGAQTVDQGVTMVTVVTVVVAHGRAVTILTKTNNKDLLAAVDAAVMGMKIETPAAASSPAAAGDLDEWVFKAPAGWEAARGQGNIMLTDKAGGCSIMLLPPRPSGPTLEDDLERAYAEVFNGWNKRDEATGNPYIRVAKGVSVDGWELIKADTYLTRGADKALGMLFVARLDGKSMALAGMRPGADLTSVNVAIATATPQCLDEYLDTDWPELFHSLHFKSWKPRGNELAKKVVGKWWATTLNGALGYVLAANGRYQTIAGYQTFSRIDRTTVLATTHGFTGSGSWKLEGSELTLTPDGKNEKPEVARVRWQNVFELGQWQERLRFLEKRPDGSGYEFTLRREE